MTRGKWADLRDKHLRTPEARAAYEAAKVKLDKDLAEWMELQTLDLNEPCVKERRDRLRAEHPEWFEDSPWPTE